MKDSFVFYRFYYEAMQGLDNESKGACLDALAKYIFEGEEPQLVIPEAKLFFTLVKPQIKAETPKKTNKTVFVKPSISEISDYCQERKNKVEADKFYNFYESKGWKIGKSPMKDWKAAVRNWENNTKANDNDFWSQLGC